MRRVGIFKGKLGSGFLVLMAAALMFVWPNMQLIAAQSLPELVTNCMPEGWQIFDKIKQFMPENLYEQIDGRASFFLAYDMVEMTHVAFENSAHPGQFIKFPDNFVMDFLDLAAGFGDICNCTTVVTPSTYLKFRVP